MKNKHPTHLLTIILLFMQLSTNAQTTEKIAGSYKIKGAVLVINADNTCWALAENTVLRGVVDIKDWVVMVRPKTPSAPFVLYGRKNETIEKGNKIMFGNFVEANALVNMKENNSSFTTMKTVFNEDANCLNPPYIFNNPTQNPKFYFTVTGQDQVYSFNNNQGYNDFIVLYSHQAGNNFELDLQLSSDSSHLLYNGKVLEKLKNDISKEEINQLAAMYNRAYPEADKYYCNPAYNFFEEHGVNVHSGAYKKIEKSGAYYFINSTTEQMEDNDYNNYSKIYEYEKINATVLSVKDYTIDRSPLFTAKCNE